MNLLYTQLDNIDNLEISGLNIVSNPSVIYPFCNEGNDSVRYICHKIIYFYIRVHSSHVPDIIFAKVSN